VNRKEAVDFARIDRFSEIRNLSRTCVRESAVKSEAHDDGAACSEEIASFHCCLLCLRRAEYGG